MKFTKQHFSYTFGESSLLVKISMMKRSQESLNSEAYSKPSQKSKMKLSAKIATGFQLLTIFAKSLIIDALPGSEYTSEFNDPWLIFIIDIFTKS